MANQATVNLTDLYEWAKTQGKLGIAVLYVRAYEERRVTPQLIAQATKIRDRQQPVVVTERITRKAPTETSQTSLFSTETSSVSLQDGTILPELPRPVSPVKENPWPGSYTIEHSEGHSTFRVRIQPVDAEYAAGKTVISLLTGPDNEGDYTDFGFLRDGRLFPFRAFRGQETLIERANFFLSNVGTDAVKESRRCARCNRLLTTPESVAAGFGPECATKGFR